MANHPFRVLSERGASLEELAPLFAPDVTFHSPLLTQSVSGRKVALRSLAEGFTHLGFPKYTLELTNNEQTVLLWDGTMMGHEIQGTMFITQGDDGLIHNLSIFLRPYPVIALFWEAMREFAYGMLPKEFWESAPLTIDVPSHLKSSLPTS